MTKQPISRYFIINSQIFNSVSHFAWKWSYNIQLQISVTWDNSTCKLAKGTKLKDKI